MAAAVTDDKMEDALGNSTETQKLEKEIAFLTKLINNHKKSQADVAVSRAAPPRAQFPHSARFPATRNSLHRSSTYHPHSLIKNQNNFPQRSASVSGSYHSFPGNNKFKYVSGQKGEDDNRAQQPNFVVRNKTATEAEKQMGFVRKAAANNVTKSSRKVETPYSDIKNSKPAVLTVPANMKITRSSTSVPSTSKTSVTLQSGNNLKKPVVSPPINPSCISKQKEEIPVKTENSLSNAVRNKSSVMKTSMYSLKRSECIPSKITSLKSSSTFTSNRVVLNPTKTATVHERKPVKMQRSSTFPVQRRDHIRENSSVSMSPVKPDLAAANKPLSSPRNTKYTWVAKTRDTNMPNSADILKSSKKPVVLNIPKSPTVYVRTNNTYTGKNIPIQTLDKRSPKSGNMLNSLQSSVSRQGNSRYKFIRQSDSSKLPSETKSRSVTKSSSQTQTAARVVSSKYKLRKILPATTTVSNSKQLPSSVRKVNYRKSLNVDNNLRSSKQRFKVDNRQVHQHQKRKHRKTAVRQNLKINTGPFKRSKYKIERRNFEVIHVKSPHVFSSINRRRSGSRSIMSSLLNTDSYVLSKMLKNVTKHNYWTSKYSLKRNSDHSVGINQILGRRVKNLSKNKYKFLTPDSVKPSPQKSQRLLEGNKHSTAFPSQSKLKLDRRGRQDPKKGSAPTNENSLKIVVIGGMLYRSTATTLKKSKGHMTPKQQTKSTSPSVLIKHADLSQGRMKTVTVQGVRYKVDKSGRSLKRLPNAAMQSPSKLSKIKTKTRIDIGGETFVQTKPGTLVRISNRNMRQRASSALSRSIAWATKKKKNAKAQYCMFFNRFGRCNRDTQCPYIHDPEKVAVCTRFLRGTCKKVGCPFSHKVDKEKMPVCSYFLRGICSRDDCPYRHVNVNRDAEICADFLKGYCPSGDKCEKKHSLLCPEFIQTGQCSAEEKCKLQHPKKKTNKHKTADSQPAPRKRKRIIEETEDNPDLPFRERQLPAFIALDNDDVLSPSSSTKQLRTDQLDIKPRLSFSPMKTDNQDEK